MFFLSCCTRFLEHCPLPMHVPPPLQACENCVVGTTAASTYKANPGDAQNEQVTLLMFPFRPPRPHAVCMRAIAAHVTT